MLIRRVISMLILWAAMPVQSEPAPVLEVVTTEYPPFEYLENGTLRGQDVATVRAVVERMGYAPRFRILPWARAELMVRNGTADLLFSLTASPQRERYYLFTDPISTARDVFYARKDTDLSWSEFDDLANLRLGISASYSYDPAFMDWLAQDQAEVRTMRQEQPDLAGLRMVALDRMDLFICEQTACNYLIRTYQKQYPELSEVTAIPGTVGEERHFRAAFSRQRPDAEQLRSDFNRVLNQLGLPDSD
ncbi:substrate-binding periplasmic protein [Marinobacter sp. F4206]|uniref:substrate-binding periplasmic protein n=1 Tax=Marinobacter sp. F4206 TaxID=2861777 RepID=UPI001C5E3CFF|nr:transporter substrate-binding domain-containing protein [Marinobacter sp. F4206]MBW4934612.1 transporter substrate-binding domain-containing protein [Marinobacter sp. F4206]